MATSAAKGLWQRIKEAPKWLANGRGEERLATLEAGVGGADLPPGLGDLLANVQVRGLLTGLFEGSPYLGELALRDTARLSNFLREPPEGSFERLTSAVIAAMADAEDGAAAKRALRRYKSGVALLTGLADLGGVWPVMTVTRVLSQCADAAVSACVGFLFREAVAKGDWRPCESGSPEAHSGYFVLAMGKHGAFELNYSSDIDLIVFFDRDKARFAGGGDLQTFFVRMTRDLVGLLEERTADGYVFRTDLRLRPDAGATQLALSTAAAHSYYETVGQNWERAAFIKARACAGDIAAGTEFLDELAPFIWRKYLDYAAIADIHAMKRQIHAHRGFGGIAILGQNIKLGRGGIREIEFFVQTQQLIAGGRQPDLRVRETLGALLALERRGWVQPAVVADLGDAYAYLRRLEHRLQMVDDAQTHDMPENGEELARIARFSGEGDVDKFAKRLRGALETVERHYAGLFEDAPELTRPGANMVFAGATDDPATIAELARLGYSQPAQVLSIVRGWHHGRTPSVRSARARERLTEVQPNLIAALADTVEPDAAIASFDRFLAELPAGVQLFSLLKANPPLVRLIANIMGSAPRLSRILSRRRRLLDGVLDPRLTGASIAKSELDQLIAREFDELRRVNEGDVMQDILDRARVISAEQSFLIGVRVLMGTISAAEAGAGYAIIAECMVAALLREVTRDLEQDHGRIAGGEAVVIAMGKLGGRETTASSDLDLILVYDFDALAVQSDGPKPLAPSHYYTRLTQRLINALSAPTAEGMLYEVDMRLRPSGQKGPLAAKLSTFITYQTGEAWTWEHMAMTRARVIAGSPALWGKTEAAIRNVLVRRRDKSKVTADVLDMRQRIVAEKGTDDIWDLKQVRGGWVDLEFIAQYLQLIHAAAMPEVLDQNTLGALAKLHRAGVITKADHDALDRAGRLLHDLTQILRLCLDSPFDAKTAPAGLKALLAVAGGYARFETLEVELKSALATVFRAFQRIVR